MKVILIKIEDTGSNVVKLDTYGEFLIDDKRITIPYNYSSNGAELIVDNPYNIRQITSGNYISHFEDNGGNTLSVDDFEAAQNILKAKGHMVYDEDDECENLEFKDLDDEYEYRKFNRKWLKKYKTRESISEPFPVFEQLVKLDTGNEFITSLFTTQKVSEDQVLYNYHRNSATKKIVSDCFTKLGMEFKSGCSYGATEGKKVWGNSSHSHLEYVVAFGKYVFSGDKVSFVKGANDIKGTLESLNKQYQSDKKYLETIIESNYATHFRSPQIDGVLLGDVVIELSSIASSVSGLDVKQKSSSSQRAVSNKISTLLMKLREVAQKIID